MQYDYFAFQKQGLVDALHKLEQASEALKQAKKSKNNGSEKKQAERNLKRRAEEVVTIDPHVSYLWYEALGNDLKNDIRGVWKPNSTARTEGFNFIPDISALDYLPQLSFMLRIPFKLKKPYLSKDDRAFHLLENPIKRDKVFQTPMVASTSWKGSLRATLWHMGHQEENEEIIRLFGNARDDNKGKSGCLYFYPTFFDRSDLEVINPHDRKTGVGKNPILIESVPSDAKGSFVLLYVPFGGVSATQVAEDLELVAEGVREMLTVYGFGAKTSSGFGVVEDRADGKIVIKYPLPRRQEVFSTLDEMTIKANHIAENLETSNGTSYDS